MRGRPATGSMRRKICGGLNTRSKRLKRGVKSVMRSALPLASRMVVCDDRRVAQVGASAGDRPLQHHVAEALLLVAGKQAREDGIGIEARKAPPQDAAAASISAAMRQLPITARSRGLPPGRHRAA